MAQMDQFSAQVQGQAMDQQAQMSTPLPLKVLGAIPLPTLTQTTAFNATRYANTMFSGGFLDTGAGTKATRTSRLRQSIGKRTGAYVGDVMSDPADYALGKNFMGKFAMKKVKAQATNLTPFAGMRFDSVSRLAGTTGKGTSYTPFQGGSFVADMLLKPKFMKTAASKFFGDAVYTGSEANPLWTGGVFGRLNTASRADDFQKAKSAAASLRATPGFDEASASRAQRRVLARGDKAAEKLGRLEANLFKLGKQTNAPFMQEAARAKLAAIAGPYGAAGITDEMVAGALKSGFADDAAKAAMGTMSITEKLMATLPGQISKDVFGYGRIIAGDFSNVLKANPAVANRVVGSFANAMEATKMTTNAAGVVGALDDAGHAAKSAMSIATRTSGYADDVMALLETGNVKAMRSVAGKVGIEAFKQKQYGTALKMGGHYVGTYGKLAGKAFSAYGWATLAYDVGKGVGNAIMGGINFQKEALKSMQGSINKPIFGAGFKDNEVAATSRARGVMAIQNSRLNARSMLGSEGSMLAAHFG